MSRRANHLFGIAAFVLGTLPLSAETIPSGTEIVIRLEREVEAARKDNEPFSATLAFPVFAHGREVVPVGSKVEGEVRGTKKALFLSPRQLILPDGRRVDFQAVVQEIDSRRLEAERKEGTIEDSGNTGEAVQQAGQVGVTGAGIGAMTTGTAKGTAIGAAIGVAAVLIGRKIAGSRHPTVIPAGTQLTLSLTGPLDIPDNLAESQAPRIVDSELDRRDRRPVLRREDSEPQ